MLGYMLLLNNDKLLENFNNSFNSLIRPRSISFIFGSLGLTPELCEPQSHSHILAGVAACVAEQTSSGLGPACSLPRLCPAAPSPPRGASASCFLEEQTRQAVFGLRAALSGWLIYGDFALDGCPGASKGF